MDEFVETPEDETYEGAQGGTGAVRLVSLLPGGDEPQPTEVWVALIVLAALGFLVITRRGLRDVLARAN